MTAEKLFFDTNILVYAHDCTEGAKHHKARQIVEAAWASPLLPTISIQVLQETHVTLTRKGLDAASAASIVRNYLEWDLIENREPLFVEALELQIHFGLSFWDASILAAALAGGARELWSEDFQADRVYHGVRIVNPFQTTNRTPGDC